MSLPEILREFLLETHENLALLDANLIRLEKNPTERETLAEVFRTLHSVKGTAGFMGLAKLETIAHAAESLLAKLRAGELIFNPEIATALLRVVDAIRDILSHIEASTGEGDTDYGPLAQELDRLRTGDANRSDSQSTASMPPVAPASTASPHEPRQAALTTEADSPPKVISPPQVLSPTEVVSPPVGTTSVVSPSVVHPESPPPSGTYGSNTFAIRSPETSQTAQLAVPDGSTANLGITNGTGTVGPVGPASQLEPSESRGGGAADSAIRVDVGLLDNLMTLMGELILARNQILQHSQAYDDGAFQGAVQRLNLLTTELQSSVMKARLQPIGNLLKKFQRIVRDLSIACGKKVDFEVSGQTTELDKTLIEAIRDPLTHIIRNAVDHGIESPATRRERGKPEEGRLRMHAFHEEGKVIIEISDDGAGIDVQRVRDKAVNAKLISAVEAAAMSRQELLRLIFLPGLSTADRVTQFSGRGVGMDVVRTNIEKIGGTVEIDSSLGQGTTLRVKIPLTLAIMPALIVASGQERYAIPQVNLLELVRFESDQARGGVEWIHGAPVCRLRGVLLPLVFLDEQLGLAAARGEAERLSSVELNIVVVKADNRRFGLVVDAIRDTEEIVVKPLQKQLKGIPVFAGATIMGDGGVALVLDIVGLAQHSGVVSGAKGRSLAEDDNAAKSAPEEVESLLLFTPSSGGRMAIRLAEVARLEEFPRASLELLGTRQVVQYRGEILPLIDLSHELGRPAPIRREDELDRPVPVVVHSHGGGQVGLIVREILDIVSVPTKLLADSRQRGRPASAVIKERVTELVDIPTVLQGALSGFHGTAM
jgi:two-component system chemotaxis sensor kinase CheA